MEEEKVRGAPGHGALPCLWRKCGEASNHPRHGAMFRSVRPAEASCGKSLSMSFMLLLNDSGRTFLAACDTKAQRVRAGFVQRNA